MTGNAARKLTFGIKDLLQGYSAEVISGDRKTIDDAACLMAPGAEVFIASLPSDTADKQVQTAAQLTKSGLTPVPHIVARNLRNRADFDTLLGRLAGVAGVDRVLLLAGDRDQPAGDYDQSLQLLQTGLLRQHGIRRVCLSWYPEGHPRIADAVLDAARTAKLAVAAQEGLEVTLVSQFCFESAPIVASARRLRAAGVTVPLRVGLAGPASRTSLLKYAMICGVGASIRALKERPAARGMLAGDTPEVLLWGLAAAQAAEPALGIRGIHFFTFASLAATTKFVNAQRQSGVAL